MTTSNKTTNLVLNILLIGLITKCYTPNEDLVMTSLSCVQIEECGIDPTPEPTSFSAVPVHHLE